MFRRLVCLPILLAACLPALVALGAEPGIEPSAVPRLSKPEDSPAQKEFAHPEALLSTDALAKLLEKADPKLVILDARGKDQYIDGHLPNARNIQSDQFQDPQRPPYFLPAPEVVKQFCVSAGIDAESRVVIYDADDGRLAARVWFTLFACGHHGTAILDGGANKWKDEGRAWTRESSSAARGGTFSPAAELRGVCAFADLSRFGVRVRALGQMPATAILDARSLPEYMGEDLRAKSGGHIPGAANIEWSALLTGKEHARVWRSPPEIDAILRLAGVDREQKIAVYDQAGGRSAHLFFSLWLMGISGIVNYSGGWREYGNRDDVEIER